MYKKILLVGSTSFVNEIKQMLLGFLLEADAAYKYAEIESKLKSKKFDIAVINQDSYIDNISLFWKVLEIIKRSKIPSIIFSVKKNLKFVELSKKYGILDYCFKPCSRRELALRIYAIFNKKIRITCIGGGSGLFNLLLGIKTIPQSLITSVVSTTDDGGSSGRIRASFGVLPPGDIRRNLVALSNAPVIMNELMQYRFDKGGGLNGHSLGNLLLTALTNIKSSMPEAVSALSELLNLNGIVYPVADEEAVLYALIENGKIIKGESNIDSCRGRARNLRIKKIWHNPQVPCDANAYSAIINADFITIGPGDLFTSIITNLIIKDIRKAVVNTKAKKIYICNLMTKPGETSNYNSLNHIEEIIKYLGGDYLDYILLADNSKLPKKELVRYAQKDQYPVDIGNLKKISNITKAKVIVADLSSKIDLIQHDSMKIRDEINDIIERRV
ncbi:MAG: uridine diphosphate-N-acetylglucosamine-binding protein YvcK [Candidatus Omnitrophota bacterium]